MEPFDQESFFENVPNFLEEFEYKFTNNAVIKQKIDETNDVVSQLSGNLDLLLNTLSKN